MWFSSFLLFLTLTSVIAGINDDIEHCKKEMDFEDLERLASMEGRVELEVGCPMLFNFFSCMEKVVRKHLGVSLTELVEMTNGTEVGKSIEIAVNIKSIIEDLCTEGTQLHTDYLADIDCFDGIENPIDLCRPRAERAYEAFKGFAETIEEETADDDFEADKDCFKIAYQFGCTASVIHDTCGRRAFNTYNTVIKRTKILKNAVCSQRGVENLQTTFLNSLELEETEKDLFRLIFELRKRRK